MGKKSNEINISGKQILEKGDIDAYGIWQMIRMGLPVVGSFNSKIKVETLKTVSEIPSNLESFVSSLQFPITEYWNFKNKYRRLLESEPKKGVRELESLSSEEARELGRLRKEKIKWDRSIEAAVHIGIFCSKQDRPITRATLEDNIYKIDRDLPKTTIEKIWKAIPEKYRHTGGRPRIEPES